ncbi:MAG: aminoacyl--tRNA ligase-related protein [Microthrixaceae bacterium]
MSEAESAVAPDPEIFDKIVNLSKRRGIAFQSAEIYGGFRSTYDYGPVGVLLLRNVKDAWWRSMVQMRHDVVGLDAAILGPPAIWEASGHLANFTDPLVDCATASRVTVWTSSTTRTCAPPVGSKGSFTEARDFNLMFKTHAGPVAGAGGRLYLRPETAQGMFVNFANVLNTSRKKPPFGIAQIGKSFRNEITPGNFVFRTREFEQMEMEFFVPPAEAEQWYEYWCQARYQWYLDHGIPSRSCACAPTTPMSSRTTPRARATWSSCSRGAGTSSRASPTAATTTSPSTRRTPARASTTSTRPPTSATCRTSSSRQRAPRARRWRSSSRPTPRTR